ITCCRMLWLKLEDPLELTLCLIVLLQVGVCVRKGEVCRHKRGLRLDDLFQFGNCLCGLIREKLVCSTYTSVKAPRLVKPEACTQHNRRAQGNGGQPFQEGVSVRRKARDERSHQSSASQPAD